MTRGGPGLKGAEGDDGIVGNAVKEISPEVRRASFQVIVSDWLGVPLPEHLRTSREYPSALSLARDGVYQRGTLAIIQAVYRNNQNWNKEREIGFVLDGFRGHGGELAQRFVERLVLPKYHSGIAEVHPDWNPISSWSWAFDSPRKSLSPPGEPGLVLFTSFSIERLLSNPSTGFGSARQREFTALSGPVPDARKSGPSLNRVFAWAYRDSRLLPTGEATLEELGRHLRQHKVLRANAAPDWDPLQAVSVERTSYWLQPVEGTPSIDSLGGGEWIKRLVSKEGA